MFSFDDAIMYIANLNMFIEYFDTYGKMNYEKRINQHKEE